MFNRHLRCMPYALLLPLTPALAQSDDIAPMPPASPSLHVGEMLVIDANRALAAEQGKPWPTRAATPSATSSAMAYRHDDALHSPPSALAPDVAAVSLLAIYGVGKRLYADVRIDGSLVSYAFGRAMPIRASRSQMGWKLQHIRPPCITLLDQAGQTHESCIGGS